MEPHSPTAANATAADRPGSDRRQQRKPRPQVGVGAAASAAGARARSRTVRAMRRAVHRTGAVLCVREPAQLRPHAGLKPHVGRVACCSAARAGGQWRGGGVDGGPPESHCDSQTDSMRLMCGQGGAGQHWTQGVLRLESTTTNVWGIHAANFTAQLGQQVFIST